MLKRIGAFVLALGAAPLFAAEVEAEPVAEPAFQAPAPVRPFNSEDVRCARGDYSDDCFYRSKTARAVEVQARPFGAQRCVVVSGFGQSWCDDRRRFDDVGG